MATAVYRAWDLVGPQHIKMNTLTFEDLCQRINQSPVPVGIGIDGSSTNTGLAVMSKVGALISTSAVSRDKGEDYIQYKLSLQDLLTKLLLNCKDKITHVWYEEPFVGFNNAAQVLMAIRTVVKEIIYTHPELSFITYTEVNNKRWKKIFLEQHNSRLPSGGSEAEKKAIADILKVKLTYDNLYDTRCCVSQDEMDAAGLVYAGWYGQKENIKLESKKQIHKFKFNIKFELYDADPSEVEQNLTLSLLDSAKEYKIPTRVLDNGVTITMLSGRKLFDNIVYETMEDNDKLLVFIYDAGKYTNILMTYGMDQGITEQLNRFGEGQTLVAYVWRKSRKSMYGISQENK